MEIDWMRTTRVRIQSNTIICVHSKAAELSARNFSEQSEDYGSARSGRDTGGVRRR
jgi:hypothetical protein